MATATRVDPAPEELAHLYRTMLLVRLVDERMITLQRQGRIGFYGANTGEEAAALASALAFEPGDWIFPALRQAGAMLLRGYPLRDFVGQVFGNAADEQKGRQPPAHYASRRVNQVSWSPVIGNQLPQAVGAAMAAKIRGERAVVAAYLGDGASSTPDFHVALNFAGVFRAPVVFLCQNNQWSISVPRRLQTASETIAEKAVAYGLPGVKVDGNDALAVYAATKEAVDRARAGGGATLVELETYRIGAHTTSDDPSRYRDEAEVEPWRRRDPIDGLRRVLVERRLWNDEQDRAARDEINAEIGSAIKAAEGAAALAPETMFDDVFARSQWHLEEQREEALAPAPEMAEPP